MQSSQEADEAADSDEDQVVKVLRPIRADDQEVDPAFEAELLALMGPPRAPHPATGAAPPSAPASAPSTWQGADELPGVAFHVVLRKAGAREAHSRLVQVNG